jgi:GxGYxYP putative glycoside hydrolase C-terminal domain/GxGYxYP_N second domain/GxGYxYP_N 1st domain/GxGYxYP third domain
LLCKANCFKNIFHLLHLVTVSLSYRVALALSVGIPIWAGIAPLRAEEGNLFPKGHKPQSLVAIDMRKLDRAEQVMVSTLQGVLAKSSSKQIFMEAGDEPPWKRFLAEHEGVVVTTASDPWRLLAQFATDVDGYILYDYATNQASVNVATSLCGIYRAIAVDSTIEARVNRLGVKRRILDVRHRREQWVYDHYRSRLNPMLAAELNQAISYHLRDYAVMANAFVFSDRGPMRQRVLTDWPQGGVLMGYTDVSAKGEYASFVDYSSRGLYYLGADLAYNLSALSGFDDEGVHQLGHPPDPLVEPNVHYVTFLMSDGDNVAFDQWSLYFKYGSPLRGKFNMGWPMLVSMADYAPSLLRWYYANASASSGRRDNFIAAGGITGSYLNAWPTNQLLSVAQRLNAYMKRADMRVLLTIGDAGFTRLDVWQYFTMQPAIVGVIYVNYGGANTGKLLFSNGKPVVEISDALWQGVENEQALAKRINSAPRDSRRPEGYSAVLVHAWSMDLSNVQRTIDLLEPHVRVVTPEEFITLIRKNAAAKTLGAKP